MGREKAAVFPDPVSARPIMSLPRIHAGKNTCRGKYMQGEIHAGGNTCSRVVHYGKTEKQQLF